MRLRELAESYLQYFKQLDNTYKLQPTENIPEELKTLVHNAHDSFLPDDYKYLYIVESLNMIVDSTTEDNYMEDITSEIEADTYNHELLEWLNSNINRANYCDQYIEEYGELKDVNLMERIAYGQLYEKQQVFYSVLNELRKIVVNIEEEEENND